MWYVYILKCRDGSFYTGCTNDLKDRIYKHSRKQIHYTQDKLPIKLMTYIALSNKDMREEEN